MNLIKKWLGIYELEHRINELQIEINELKAYQVTDRDNITKIATLVVGQKREPKEIKKPGRKPKKKVE